MKLAVAASVLMLLSGLVVACGDSGSTTGKPSATVPAVSRQEIAQALTSFSEAFVNHDEEVVGNLLSVTCGSAERGSLLAASELLGHFFEGTYELDVVAAELVFEVRDARVIVPLEQPEGVLSATISSLGEPTQPTSDLPLGLSDVLGLVEEPLLFEAPIEFAWERGRWKVANCADLFLSDDEEEDEEAESTATVQPAP